MNDFLNVLNIAAMCGGIVSLLACLYLFPAHKRRAAFFFLFMFVAAVAVVVYVSRIAAKIPPATEAPAIEPMRQGPVIQPSVRATTSSTLDEARLIVPDVLSKIYRALDQGNPEAARGYLSPAIAGNAQSLDFVCKPFSYRAHYVDAIIERPGRRFETRIRALFQPMQESAYVLTFGLLDGHLVLVDVGPPTEDWFGSQFQAAEEQARRFVYALNAGRQDVAAQIASPSLVQRGLPNVLLQGRTITNVHRNEVTRLYPYKGLKILVNFWLFAGDKPLLGGDLSITLLLDSAHQPAHVVAWAYGNTPFLSNWVEDAGLEAATLDRFGLSSSQTSGQIDKCPVFPVSCETGSRGVSQALLPVIVSSRDERVLSFAVLVYAKAGFDASLAFA